MSKEIETNLEQDDSLDESALSSAFVNALASSTEEASVEDESQEPVDEVVDNGIDEVPEETTEGEAEVVSDLSEDLIKEAKEAGLDPSQYKTGAELALATMRHLREMQPLVSYARQIAPHADEIREFLTKKDQAVPKEPESQKPTDEFDASKYLQEQYGGPVWKSEFDRAISAGQVRIDENTGTWSSAPGYEVLVGSLVAEMNAVQGHATQFWRDVAKGNPYERFFGVMKEPLLREVERRVQEALTGREEKTATESYVQTFERENASWLYSTDPKTGGQVLTDRGQEFVRATAEAQELFGMQDPVHRIKYAQRVLGVTSPAKQEQPTVAQQPVKKEDRSFLESAKRRASHSPSASVRQNGEAVPQVVTENDLDNLFVNAHRQSVSG